MKTILLVNHDCDLVLYKAFEALAKRMAYRIVIAAPEGTEIPAVEGAERVAITPLKSKFDLKGRRALRRAIRDTGADYVFCVSTTALANALAHRSQGCWLPWNTGSRTPIRPHIPYGSAQPACLCSGLRDRRHTRISQRLYSSTQAILPPQTVYAPVD